MKEWCEHCKLEVVGGGTGGSCKNYICNATWVLNDTAKFCPICAAPKPITKTKKERLAEKLRQDDFSKPWEEWLQLAEIALEFLQENKEGL